MKFKNSIEGLANGYVWVAFNKLAPTPLIAYIHNGRLLSRVGEDMASDVGRSVFIGDPIAYPETIEILNDDGTIFHEE